MRLVWRVGQSLLDDMLERQGCRSMQYLFAISGYKHTGKTTLITKLIPLLKNKGYKVAVIKHDGHDFEGDVPDTDSYKAFHAGAYGTAVFSKNKFLIHKKISDIDENELQQAFPEADIILLEGFKDSAYPKYICDYPNNPIIEPEILAERIITGIQYEKNHC